MNCVAVFCTKLKSGGTSHYWFDTDKIEADKELLAQFLSKFPEIEKVVSIGIYSNLWYVLGFLAWDGTKIENIIAGANYG